MSENIHQIYIANPITINTPTDLIYFGQSPYGAGNDAAMTYSNFSAQFPGKTGIGASGTWGINISGNAATATSSTSASSVAVGGITGLGTGVATALASNVTGSGGIALITSPTFVTPTLGAAIATSITFSPTTGGIVGTTTNNNASSGYVGEFITSQVLFSGSPISLSTTTPANITSVNLSAGDWNIEGNVAVEFGGLAVYVQGWLSLTSATLPDESLIYQSQYNPASPGVSDCGPVPFLRVSISSPTTVYLSCVAGFTSSTANAAGGIFARRIR